MVLPLLFVYRHAFIQIVTLLLAYCVNYTLSRCQMRSSFLDVWRTLQSSTASTPRTSRGVSSRWGSIVSLSKTNSPLQDAPTYREPLVRKISGEAVFNRGQSACGTWVDGRETPTDRRPSRCGGTGCRPPACDRDTTAARRSGDPRSVDTDIRTRRASHAEPLAATTALTSTQTVLVGLLDDYDGEVRLFGRVMREEVSLRASRLEQNFGYHPSATRSQMGLKHDR